MRTLTIATGLLALGCADGPNDETLVPELRVLAIQADPPEAAPGGQVDLNVTIADPLGTGAEVLLWHCTDLGTGCLEDGTEHSWRLDLVEDGVSATATVPLALAALASEEPLRATQLWALACEPGLCPQVEEPEAWDLSDPSAWLADLPMSGVSLGLNLMAISTREDRLANPELALATAQPLEIDAGGVLNLAFDVLLHSATTDEAYAFGYATAGGFELTEYAVGDDGEVSLAWYAPEEPSTAELYVVVNDGEGGVGVWTGQAQVR